MTDTWTLRPYQKECKDIWDNTSNEYSGQKNGRKHP